MFKRIGFCVGLKMFILQANGIAGFGGLNLFSLVFLSEVEECVAYECVISDTASLSCLKEAI
jgi:hypothetical protein